MKKSDIQSNPIPSYTKVRIYVTYQGQAITFQYCGGVGYVQSECHKRETDFLALTRSKPRESSTAVPETIAYPEPVNFSKKQKILQSDFAIRVSQTGFSVYCKLN